MLWAQLWALLNIALHSYVLSYKEHHKHLHFNVHNESQLSLSTLFQDHFPLHCSHLRKVNVTTVITLKGLLLDNHVDLITEKTSYLRRTQKQRLEREKNVLCLNLLFFFFFLRILEALLIVQQIW